MWVGQESKRRMPQPSRRELSADRLKVTASAPVTTLLGQPRQPGAVVPGTTRCRHMQHLHEPALGGPIHATGAATEPCRPIVTRCTIGRTRRASRREIAYTVARS